MMINNIIDYLDSLYPNPVCELKYNKDYELLIAIVMSAQTTDKRVNMVNEILFSKYDSLEKLYSASIEDIEDIIRPIGTYRKKSIFIKEIASRLISDGIKIIPNDRGYLESLPGVGRKTTNVILGLLYDVPTMPVDTHVNRVAKRLQISNIEDDINKTEQKLMKFFPIDTWNRVHHQLVLFGRYHCKSIKPSCDYCPFKSVCKKDYK